MKGPDKKVADYIRRAQVIISNGEMNIDVNKLEPYLIEIAKMIQVEDMRYDGTSGGVS